jgi:hypothetical protein
MLAEYPELSIRPLKTNVGYERLLRPIQLAPQTTETYLGFSKFGRSTGGDFSTRDFAGDEPALLPNSFSTRRRRFSSLLSSLAAERRLPSNRESILN